MGFKWGEDFLCLIDQIRKFIYNLVREITPIMSHPIAFFLIEHHKYHYDDFFR